MRAEAQKWLREAESDLKAARDSLKAENYNWACFQARQCGEKAIKSFLYNKGYTSIMTHSLKELVTEASKLEKFIQIKEEAKFLDMFYLPTRYPNTLAGNLTPSEFYEREDAQKCISCAESILKITRSYLPR
jgi:HEPN domain-containing protein